MKKYVEQESALALRQSKDRKLERIARLLGIETKNIGMVCRFPVGKKEDQYLVEKYRTRAKKALKVFKEMSERVARLLFDYKTQSAEYERNESPLDIQARRCGVCNGYYRGAYEICHVCIDTYLVESSRGTFREKDSCQALAKIDGMN